MTVKLDFNLAVAACEIASRTSRQGLDEVAEVAFGPELRCLRAWRIHVLPIASVDLCVLGFLFPWRRILRLFKLSEDVRGG